MSPALGQAQPVITNLINAQTSPLWQALAKRRGKQPVYLLACLRTGACPEVRLLPTTPRMHIAREAIRCAQEAQPGTYAGAVTLYQRMWGACRASGLTVLTRPEVLALMARECSDKAILKVVRALVAAGLVGHLHAHAAHWYRPETLSPTRHPAGAPRPRADRLV